jgi:hypothetical protein
MAAKSALGMRREAAIKRMQESTASLFKQAVDLPIRGKDADMLHVQQLEAIADYLMSKAAAKKRQKAKADDHANGN